MRKISLGCACCLLFSALAASALPLDVSSGDSLARTLRSSEPEDNSDIPGTLIIHTRAGARTVPIDCRVLVNGSTWQTDYQTASADDTPAEHLIVVHSVDGPNQYLFSRADAPGEPAPAPKPIAADEANMALAGSDFSLADLGLQFLHWPVQRRLRDQDRLGQACYVLESNNPDGKGIVQVKSFIDKQTGGILTAEADDAEGHLVKLFSLHGSSFKKINGHWRLQKMEISNHRTHSRTELKFNLDAAR